MKRRTKVIGFLLIALWTVSPILSVLIAGGLASAFGCQLDEGSVHPCMAFGADIGGLLYNMFVMGWFFFLTVPSGIAAAVIFLIIVLIAGIAKRRADTGR